MDKHDRTMLEASVWNFEDLDEMFNEVQKMINSVELDAEEIITFAINTDERTEVTNHQIDALKKLCDSLRRYKRSIVNLRKGLTEVMEQI